MSQPIDTSGLVERLRRLATSKQAHVTKIGDKVLRLVEVDADVLSTASLQIEALRAENEALKVEIQQWKDDYFGDD